SFYRNHGVNALGSNDLHRKVHFLPPFGISPVKREANMRSGRRVLRRQIDKMDSETDFPRVVVVTRRPLVRRPTDPCRRQELDAQLLASWDAARLLIEAPRPEERLGLVGLMPLHRLRRRVENAALAHRSPQLHV